MTKYFTYGSGFAGTGGMTLGLRDLGGKGVIAWEFDPTEKSRQYAQDAHKLLHPEIPVHGDICEANTDELPDFDLFCFTPPCQSFSVAGKRGGFEDTRGTLTFEALRIAKDKQPKILFMENVKGLINHDKGNTMSVIVHAINDIGYTVDFTVLNSKYFDVAQNRERVYLVAVRNDLVTPEPWINTKGNTMLPKARSRYQAEGVRTFNFDWPEQVEVRTRLRDFLEETVDEKYYISEEKTAALVKQLEQGLAIKEATKQGFAIAKEGDSVNIQFPNSKTRRGRVGEQIANTLECGVNQGVVEKAGNVNPSGNGMNGNVFSIDAGLSPTLTTNKGEGIKFLEDSPTIFDVSQIGHEGKARLYHDIAPTITAREYKEPRMVGRNERDSGRIIELGKIKEHRHSSLMNTIHSVEGISSTLDTMNGGGREPKIAEEHQRYRIRKLTPRECLRLQAIPENAIDKLESEFSNSRLYKFAGNGLTINVIRAIGEKLLKYL